MAIIINERNAKARLASRVKSIKPDNKQLTIQGFDNVNCGEMGMRVAAAPSAIVGRA